MESREQAALRAAGERMARDERFAGARGARYRAAPARARTLQLDGRFASMFTDRQFRVKATLDKRGRPRPETSHENLRRFYTLDEPEREEPEPEPQPHLELDRRIRERLLDPEVDYARGEGVLQSDSSSEEESSQEEESSGEEHAWGELDADADTTDAPTDRLAVCNMDWDNMSAQDIMVLFHSFLPPGGLIHSVSIYPSEYGLKRMQEEEVRGPIELTEKREPADLSDGSDNEEGAAYNMERLRRYQLTRLRYYYALVQCDSASTADHLYAQCDGLEYESSATKLDLRFVPPDCTFSQEPKEVCSSLPELSGYRPRVFTTSALQQARVQLTWDATDPGRSELIRSALHGGQVDDLQLREYLASSSSEDERDQHNRNGAEEEAEGEVDAISKYKRLLAEVSEKEQGKGAGLEMEVTWGLGVKEKAEQLVRKAQAEEKNLTPFEKQMEKRKEKKKQKKLERQQKLERVKRRAGEESEPEEDDAPPDVDMSDPYFAEEFDKPEFRSEHKHKVGKRASAAPETEDERRRRAELELLLEGDGEGENGRSHFSLKNIQAAENDSNKSRRRRKLKQKMAAAAAATDDFQINVKDERFSAVFDSHHFNIDPTDPNYKKTRNMERLIEEKQRRRPAEEQRRQVVGEGEDVAGGGKRSRREAELSVLVKSIRRKTQQTNKQK